MNDPSSGRSAYRSPEAVLAEARRMAADIRRRAEREAFAVRREAAEWASETRREAERHRARVLADLEHAAQAVTPAPEPVPSPEPAPPAAAVSPEPEADHEPESETEMAEEAESAPLAALIDLRAAAEARGTPMASEPRPAVGGTYVVGHRPAPVETSIESKVHDVVRLAVRRTFNRQFP